MSKKDIPNGHKFDAGKARYELIPPKAIQLAALILTGGANKYNENNWTGLKASRIIGATWRHLNLYQSGQDMDKDSGMHHIGHVLANLLMLHHVVNNFPSQDDRLYKEFDDVEKDIHHIFRDSRGETEIPQYSLVPPDSLESAAKAFTVIYDLNGHDNWTNKITNKTLIEYSLNGFIKFCSRDTDDLGPSIAYMMVLSDQLYNTEFDDRIFTYIHKDRP